MADNSIIESLARVTFALRLSPFLASAVLAFVLGGCAAAAPGYVPPSTRANTKGFPVMKPFDSGKVVEGQTYQVSEAERKLNCKKLTGSQQVAISRLEARKTSVPPSQLATAMQTASAPLLKQSTRNADLASEVALEHARFKAFNDLLTEKGCATVEMPAALKPQ